MTVFKPKADYSAIASTYDEARRLPPGTIEQWVDLIRDRGKLAPGSICLDLGCGTGRFAIPLAEIPGITVVGADLTEEMLRQAVSKPGAEKVYWVRCSAERPAFRHDVFQCVFMSLLLHHVDDMDRVLAECFRSLPRANDCA
jgi:demethylmenaquinone methyltransferase/2-methoxy-6-polyprenyl-1,4-benzoquinol methylase